MNLSVILVNYRSAKWLNACLVILKELQFSKFSFEVIIVNNDQEKFKPKKDYSFVSKIIQNKRNLGFGSANNIGATKALGRNLLFLNPDTVFKKDSIEKLLFFLEKNPRIGVLSPKIIQASRGQAQPFTCGRKTSLLGILFRNTFFKPWNNKSPILVDWVSGTALLTRKYIYDKVCGFDENFFMYFEDQDLCLRIKKLGYDIVFFPKSTVLHYDGKCWPDTKKQKYAFYKAQDYFFKKHHRRYKCFILKVLKQIAL
ncbi:glycosyltransferase family 2 protein [bacterium]|nr:glycosyltransferase family 2 protein [bacterium]